MPHRTSLPDMQWYHYLNAAAVGVLAYWYWSRRDRLSDDERAEFEAAMAMEDQDLGQDLEQHEQPQDAQDGNENVARDPAAALAERQAQNNEPVQLNSWKNREVGAKKARSLALKAQRRNYSEYMEEQARIRRQEDELEQEMYGDLIAKERAQRERRSEQARIKLEDQQRSRREAEEKERKAQLDRSNLLRKDVETQGYAKIKENDDLELLAELGTVTGSGEYVVGGPKILKAMQDALSSGEATWSELVHL